MRNKIPCIVVIFFNTDIIRKCIEFLLECEDMLDITVVENKSSYTDTEIKPYIMDLLMKKRISRYVLFEDNISNNASELLFKYDVIKNLESHEFFIFTDGDIVVKDNEWFTEELKIMDKNKEVFACGIKLSKDNLPLKKYPNAYNWVPPAIHEYEDYSEVFTGMQLLMIRTKDFYDYIKYTWWNNVNCVDSTMHAYAYRVLRKKWARTKNSEAIHLSWDLCNVDNHPYHIWKSSHSLRELWDHKRYCSFEVFTLNSEGIICSEKIDINKKRCRICGQYIDKFVPWNGVMSDNIEKLNIIGSDLENYSCPHCGVDDRTRHLFAWFNKLEIFKNNIQGKKILHISPEEELQRYIKSMYTHEYVLMDDFNLSEFEDNYFDFIICNHVFEHITDDLKAMMELYRILKNGGKAIVQTPYSVVLDKSYEDPGIVSEVDKLYHYGQSDHVRVYGLDFFKRLKAAGFRLNIIKDTELFSKEYASYYGFNHDEDLIMVIK